jgi:F-type H+-transporting ATPase subunit b
MEQVTPNYTIIIQAIIFLVSLFIIKKYILGPISELLLQRSIRIEGGEQEARRLEQEANTIDSAYRQKIHDARVRAMAVRNEIRQEALANEKKILENSRKEAHGILEQIRQETAKEVQVARTMLHQQASELSVWFGEKILGRKIQ